jgi:hypothetical protein
MSTLTDEDLCELQKRIARMKADILFEEPCPIYEAGEDEWDDFWYEGGHE